MPKQEFDFDDPMELNGVGLVCNEDTTEAMTECFIEEFMRLGYNDKQLLALFRNPHYIGMNLALQNRGEAFVREKITEIFQRWGRPIRWAASDNSSPPSAPTTALAHEEQPAARTQPELTDPMGAPIPDIPL
jgi:hypothetical protein